VAGVAGTPCACIGAQDAGESSEEAGVHLPGMLLSLPMKICALYPILHVCFCVMKSAQMKQRTRLKFPRKTCPSCNHDMLADAEGHCAQHRKLDHTSYQFGPYLVLTLFSMCCGIQSDSSNNESRTAGDQGEVRTAHQLPPRVRQLPPGF
jgi:hypothetical protein